MSSYGERLRTLAPHYVAIVILILVGLAIADFVIGDLSRGMRLGVAVVIAVAYPVILRQLGLAPEPWA